MVSSQSTKMHGKVKAIIALVLLLFISGTEQRECFTEGECKESFQITGSILDNQYECRKACQSSTSCNWFTYFQHTSYCQLYKNCLRIDPNACKECLSGEKDCSAPELKCWVTGKCKEVPFSRNTTRSSEECLESCQSDSECEWFTFDTKELSCSLHRSCSSLAGCEACISGNSKCRVTSKESEWHLIIGGAGPGSPNTAELYNWRTMEQCQLPNLPVGVAAHVAASLDGVPVFCEAGSESRSCYKMDKATKTWVSIASLLAGVEFGKSIVVPSQGWIVFGRLGNTLEKAQQLTSLEADWKEGPDFITEEDAYKNSHCIFQISEIKTGLIEFRTNQEFNEYGRHENAPVAFLTIIDWSTMTNTLAGTIKTGKLSNQACAVMKINNETIELTMTGGTSMFGYYLIKIGPSYSLESWSTTAKRLPMEYDKHYGLSNSQLLSIKKGSELLLYGGQIGGQIFDGIYKFMAASKTWLQVGKMKFPRAAHVVVPVQGLSCP